MAGVDGLVFRVEILLGSATAQVLAVGENVAVFHQHQVDVDLGDHLGHGASVAIGGVYHQAHLTADRSALLQVAAGGLTPGALRGFGCIDAGQPHGDRPPRLAHANRVAIARAEIAKPWRPFKQPRKIEPIRAQPSVPMELRAASAAGAKARCRCRANPTVTRGPVSSDPQPAAAGWLCSVTSPAATATPAACSAERAAEQQIPGAIHQLHRVVRTSAIGVMVCGATLPSLIHLLFAQAA